MPRKGDKVEEKKGELDEVNARLREFLGMTDEKELERKIKDVDARLREYLGKAEERELGRVSAHCIGAYMEGLRDGLELAIEVFFFLWKRFRKRLGK